jgi:TorA maturation chaperone TorD
METQGDLAKSATEYSPAPQTEGGDDTMRANMYRLLATLTSAPAAAELLERLRRIAGEGVSGNEDMGTAWRTLGLASAHATVASVDDEYHDLFVGIGRGEIVPYGSWYQTGFLMDRPLAFLRRDLAMLGILRQDGNHEPEDHISALCETMSLMADEDTGFAINVQRRFLHDHLEPWVGRFFADMQRAKSARFYAAVGQLGERFFDIERRYLEMLA